MIRKKKHLLQRIVALTLALCSIITILHPESVYANAPDIKEGLELEFAVSSIPHMSYRITSCQIRHKLYIKRFRL